MVNCVIVRWLTWAKRLQAITSTGKIPQVSTGRTLMTDIEAAFACPAGQTRTPFFD